MRKVIDHFKKIPWYGWLIGVGLLVIQMSTYWAANAISNAIGNSARAIVPKIAAIDDLIPVCGFFAIFYFYSYIYWIESYANATAHGKRKMINVIAGALAAYAFGIVIYLAVPSYMDREAEGILAISERPGLFNKLLNIIYHNDGWERAYNLFPSYHCLISVYCFLPCLHEKNVSKGYKIYSGIISACICLSTLFCKQHYIIDLVVGVALGFGFYYLFAFIDLGKRFVKDNNLDLEKE